MAMKTVWFWRGSSIDERWATVRTFSTDDYPHPSTVVSENCPVDAMPAYSIDAGENGLPVISLLDEQFDKCPNMWFILEKTVVPTPLLTIHAMHGGGIHNGTLVPVENLKTITANKPQRIGFVRWFEKDSRIQQVAVNPDWRRQRVSTALFAAADIAIVAQGSDIYLNGGDITTNDGEQLRKAWSSSRRVTPRIGSVENAVDNHE